MNYVNQLIGGALAVLLALLVLGGIYGYWTSFVPSPLMVAITIWSASVLGLVSAAFYCGFGSFGWPAGQNPKLTAKFAQRRKTRPDNRFLRGLLMGVTMFGLTWMSLGSGPPLLLTEMLGHSGEMTAVIDGWAPHSGRSCLHPTLLHVPPLIMNEHTLCTNEGAKAAMPPGTSIRIIGRVSILGADPDAIRLEP